MTRKKCRETRKLLDEAIIKAQELEKLALEAETEAENHVALVTEQITKICDENDLFCGVVLNHSQLLDIFALALKNPTENITIPFKIYHKD